MLDQVVRLLGYAFAQHALAAGIVLAIVSGLVSRFVVARNMSESRHFVRLARIGSRRAPTCS